METYFTFLREAYKKDFSYKLHNDAIHYIYWWIMCVYKRSPLLFFAHLATVLCNNPGRKEFMVILGEPYAGKTTLINLLAKILPVHRLTKLSADTMDQQLHYSAKNKLVVFDDANKFVYALLCEYRNILDGQMMVGNQKYRDPEQYKLPGVLISICAEAALLDCKKPEEEDQYYHIKTRGYHWQAHDPQPVCPELLTDDILAVARGNILLSVLHYGIDSNIFELALKAQGHLYPPSVQDVRDLLSKSSLKNDYSYMSIGFC